MKADKIIQPTDQFLVQLQAYQGSHHFNAQRALVKSLVGARGLISRSLIRDS